MLATLACAALAQSNAELEAVLTRMDQVSAGFKTAQADFVWDQFQRVISETDTQKGTVYFRRTGKGLEMAAEITSPDKKYVLFSEGKVRVYQPSTNQVTEYNAGKNKADFESFLVLGFGGRGHDLPKSFDVKYLGTEQAEGVNAAKLQLVPKQVKVRNMFDQILLWIDPARGVSVQQKFSDSQSGDYRLAKYSNIKINEKVPHEKFKLPVNSKTTYTSPQG